MFKLTLVTPEKKLVVKQEVNDVTVPGYLGELNILPGHAPMMTTLQPGVLKYKLTGSDNTNEVVITWGYCQVYSEGVNILAETAEVAEEINLDEVKGDLASAEAEMGSHQLFDDHEWEGMFQKVHAARARLEFAQGKHKHGH